MWGMLGLGDKVKATGRGARRDSGQIVEVPMDSNNMTVEYDDGERVSVPIGKIQKTKR